MTSLHRIGLLTVLALAATACGRQEQPPAPAAAPATTQAPATPTPAAEPTPPAEAPPLAEAPPPLDEQIPPLPRTGVIACDDFLENYRQCLNSRLYGEERTAQSLQLTESYRSIASNIARGVTPERTEALCHKAQRIAQPRVEKLGCTL